METEHMRELTTIAQHASFSRAASKLGLTQSALSKHVAAIERQLGVELFVRSNKETTLTPYGSIFLEDIQKVLIDYENACQRIRDLRAQKLLAIRANTFVGYRPGDDLLRSAAKQMKAGFPLFTLEVLDTTVSSPLDDVRKEVSDLALVHLSSTADLTDLMSEVLFHEPLVAIVEKSNPLSRKKTLAPDDLAHETIFTIDAPAVAEYSRYVSELLNSRGVELTWRNLPWKDAQSLYDFGFASGVLIQSASIAKNSTPLPVLEEYRAVPFSDSAFAVPLSAVYRKHDDNPATPLFLEALRGVVGKMHIANYWE
ncbi:LysR family transcriptional regulator [Adlercreutzia equolifaciens]|uniref:LysR family transcriptional regulator n=1 Tax=Adlercreutzia equolifaciens TaxID=446660 RepID=UPI0003898350|nr:LysR family transcriptional regulator [Adlercreutzia equolifaciens]RFT84450.1 LysR family transcriptional regulator [Adlercreutzia equolifaciens]BAN76889.1 hypothetical protein AEQU_0920 [Adlercreutzia equolifaciens DSM 19450]